MQTDKALARKLIDQHSKEAYFILTPPVPEVRRGIYDDDSDIFFYRKKKNRRKKTSDKLRMQVFIRDKFTCRDCPAVFPHPEPYYGQPIEGLELGHVVARFFGGQKTAENLIAQCSRCNREMGHRTWVEGWREIDQGVW